MNVHGIKRLHCVFPKGPWMVVHHLVSDTRYPAPIIAGLCSYGYGVIFDARKTTLTWKGHYRATVVNGRGLYFLEPRSRSPRMGGLDDCVIALVSSGPSAPTETTTDELSTTTATTLVYKGYHAHTFIRGKRRSGKDDYWLYTQDGK